MYILNILWFLDLWLIDTTACWRPALLPLWASTLSSQTPTLLSLKPWSIPHWPSTTSWTSRWGGWHCAARHDQGGCLQSIDAVYLLYIFEAQNLFLGLKRFMVGPWLWENSRAFSGNNEGRGSQSRSWETVNAWIWISSNQVKLPQGNGGTLAGQRHFAQLLVPVTVSVKWECWYPPHRAGRFLQNMCLVAESVLGTGAAPSK